jgi:hypothetical protein
MSKPKYKLGEMVIYKNLEVNELFLISQIDNYSQVWGGIKGNWYYSGEVMHLVETIDSNLPLIPVRNCFEEEVLEGSLSSFESILKKEKVI